MHACMHGRLLEAAPPLLSLSLPDTTVENSRTGPHNAQAERRLDGPLRGELVRLGEEPRTMKQGMKHAQRSFLERYAATEGVTGR